MNLTLAMGADHTKPENLKKIVNTINSERALILEGITKVDKYKDYVADEYGIITDVSTMSYAVEEKYDGYSYLNTEGRFFEVASIFEADELPLVNYPGEHKMLSIGAFGDGETFFTFKGATEALAKEFGIEFKYEKGSVQYLHPGMTANILLDGEIVGFMGKLAYDVCEELAIEKPVFVAELDYEKLTEKFNTNIVYKPISKFAAEKRDLALVMSEDITCGAVEEAIKSSCKYITSVNLFDVYRSEQIGEGKKSMAFSLTFTPDDHEFTGEEIDGYVNKLLRKLAFTMQIEIR